MVEELHKLRKKVKIGMVGGSDLSKQLEQLGPNGKDQILGLEPLFTPIGSILISRVHP